MNTRSLIAIYLPMFIIFFVVLPQQSTIHKAIFAKIRKRKGVVEMTNELIKRYIGKKCVISTGSFGVSVKGTIIEVNENWLEIETKKGSELINSEFIQCIKIV